MKEIRLLFSVLVLTLSTQAFATEHTCETWNTDAQGWTPDEKHIAANFKEAISRPQPCVLKIAFENGKDKEFVNRTDTKDSREGKYGIFSLEKAFTPRNFVLLRHFDSMESFHYVLLNMRNGAETYLSGIPVWAPKGDLFALVQDGGDAGYVPDTAEIWSCKDNDKPCIQLFSQVKYRGLEAYWLSSTDVVFSLATGLESTKDEKEYRLHVHCDEKSCKAAEVKLVE